MRLFESVDAAQSRHEHVLLGFRYLSTALDSAKIHDIAKEDEYASIIYFHQALAGQPLEDDRLRPR